MCNDNNPRTATSTLSIALIIVFSISTQTAWSLISTPVRIPLVQRQYALIKVGNPGKVLTLRLRFDLDTTYLFEDPRSYSDTFGDDGSDIFYLGNVKLRLPVLYELPPNQLISPFLPNYNALRSDTSGGVSYNGELGLSPASLLWIYFTSFTLSKFTFSLGKFDLLDVLDRDDGIDTLVGYQSTILFIPGDIPISFQPAKEFTYIPLALFPTVTDEIDSLANHAVELSIVSLPVVAGEPHLRFWMTRSTNVITTSFGAPEKVLRISELSGEDPTVITMGRIHMLQDFVYYENKVSGAKVVSQVFDSFPAMSGNQAPQSLLSLLGLILWAWWYFETRPMVYQWSMKGSYPGLKKALAMIRDADVPKLQQTRSRKAKSIEGEILFSRRQQQQQRGPGRDFYNHPTSRELNMGPMDWTVVSAQVAMTRVFVYFSFFVSVFGYRSERFAERIAKFSYMAPWVGAVFYYALISFCIGASLLVNSFFVRKYTLAACTLVNMTLLTTIWIDQLPDTTSVAFSMTSNLLFSTLFVVRTLEWPIAVWIRGSDSSLGRAVQSAGEYPSARQLAESTASLTGSFKQTLESGSEVIEGLRNRFTPSLPYTTSPAALASRNGGGGTSVAEAANGRFTAGDILLMAFWLLVILPVSLAWLVCLNALPFVDMVSPSNPMRIWLALFYSLVVPTFVAYCSASDFAIQPYYDIVFDMRETFQQLRKKIRQKISSSQTPS